MKVVLGALASWRLMVVDASAQNLTSGADFLKIDSGARSQGMGGAFTAVADDVNALTWNPAGLALLKQPEVGYLRMIYLSDIGYNFGGVAFPIQAGEDTLGLGAAVVNLGSPSFDSTLGLAPAVSAGDNAFSLSAAYRVKDIVAFGLTGKFILRNLAGYNASAFGGDLGVLISPIPQFHIGLGLFNLGTQVEFISEGDPLPLTGRLGLAYKVLDEPHDSLTLALDNAYDLNASMYSGSVGAEFWLENVFALRAGYTGDAYQQHWTAGTGFSLDAFEVDYAYAPLGTVGDSHRISLIVRFGAEGENLAAPLGATANPGDGFVSLNWKPAPSGSISGYNIYVRKPNATSLVRVTKHPLSASETSVKLSHLTNGETYTFGLASVSPAGRESGLITLSAMPQASIASAVSTPPPAAQLSAPTGLKAVLNQVGFDIVWDRALSSEVAGYNLYLADAEGKPGKKLNPQLMVDPKVTLKKVDPDKTYRFLVTAQGQAGNESPAALLTVLYSDLKKAAEAAALPPPPAHLILEPKGAKVRLSWDSAGEGIQYKVYVSKDGKEFRLLTSKPVEGTSATLGPLKAGQSYTFGVTSVKADGKESEKVVQTNSANP
ncbi:MAG TPA: PorV/PorQ family protein [bacterium]|nr:PorV/PorQ family protein [bacterium]